MAIDAPELNLQAHREKQEPIAELATLKGLTVERLPCVDTRRGRNPYRSTTLIISGKKCRIHRVNEITCATHPWGVYKYLKFKTRRRVVEVHEFSIVYYVKNNIVKRVFINPSEELLKHFLHETHSFTIPVDNLRLHKFHQGRLIDWQKYENAWHLLEKQATP
jgi:hypothetical protein